MEARGYEELHFPTPLEAWQSREAFSWTTVSESLAPRGLAQPHAGCQLQDLLVREPHSVRLQRVPLHLGDQLRLVLGVGLEAAVAMKWRYLFQELPRRER